MMQPSTLIQPKWCRPNLKTSSLEPQTSNSEWEIVCFIGLEDRPISRLCTTSLLQRCGSPRSWPKLKASLPKGLILMFLRHRSEDFLQNGTILIWSALAL
jgi:hypothetical protein